MLYPPSQVAPSPCPPTQVAIRTTGVWLNSEQKHVNEAKNTNCDVHHDPMDSERRWGAPLVYADIWQTDELAEAAASRGGSQRLPHTDLLVFTSSTGGRAWRIVTAHPRSVVVVYTRSRDLLHCNPYPDSRELPTDEGQRGRLHVRLVLYTLTKIDNFIERMAGERGKVQQLLAEPRLCPRMRAALASLTQ